MAKISQSSVFAATQEIGVQTHSQPAYLRPSNRRDCHALQMNIDFLHLRHRNSKKQKPCVRKNPSLLPETWKKRTVFSFQGRNHTAQQNTPNYDYEPKKTDFRAFRTLKRNPITIVTTKIQGGTAPHKLWKQKVAKGKTVAIFNNPYTVCKHIQLHYIITSIPYKGVTSIFIHSKFSGWWFQPI